jgi:fimbrial chaperone protein
MKGLWKQASILALAGAAVLCAVPLSARRAAAPASVMVWPVNPSIPSTERAAALWLENRGHEPVILQVRVFRWSIADYRDRYVADPDGIATSPPMATIAPGRRQLIRLMRTAAAPRDQEAAYRVFVDEIPRPRATAGDDAAALPQLALGVTFRLRYSLPLFVYGEGFPPAAGRDVAATAAGDVRASLDWWLASDEGRQWLYVRNRGRLHARLTRVALATPEQSVEIASGLLGYVLPGTAMRWPVPMDAPAGTHATLMASVNGDAQAPIVRD